MAVGTTSACAENTCYRIWQDREARNYLRVRGEYRHHAGTGDSHRELPPRARRILTRPGVSPLRRGTTSACAENTQKSHFTPVSARNYLRVRGEYIYELVAPHLAEELPPRARRILNKPQPDMVKCGTTSACAENTGLILWSVRFGRNYLRVRGEYFPRFSSPWSISELPPRARRILIFISSRGQLSGTTSACAENTRTLW